MQQKIAVSFNNVVLRFLCGILIALSNMSVAVAAESGLVIGSTGVGVKLAVSENVYFDAEGAAFSIKMPGSTNCVKNCSMSARWMLLGLVRKTDYVNFGIFYNNIKCENYDYDRSMKQYLKSSGSYNPIAIYVGQDFNLSDHLNLEMGIIYLGHPKFSFQPSSSKYTEAQIQYERNKAERIFGKYTFMPKLSVTYVF